MTLRDQQTSQLEFDEQEEARNPVVHGDESLFVVTPPLLHSSTAPVEGTHPSPTISVEDNDDSASVPEEDNESPTTDPEEDKDATDDEVDYGEGVDRGFRAVRVRKEERYFNGVMAAIKRMEDKIGCDVMRQKLIEHIWDFSKKDDM